MRFLIAAGVLTLFLAPLQAQTQAQTAECRTVQQSAERLACYDKAAPPVAAPQVASTAQRGATKQADPVVDEGDAINSRLRDICQRC